MFEDTMTRAPEVDDVVPELRPLAYERYLAEWLWCALTYMPAAQALAQLDAWADLPSAR